MKTKLFIYVCSLFGLILSLYSVHHHIRLHTLGRTDAICNINSDINCDQVALSSFSEVAGIPIGVFGTGYFAGLLFILIRQRRLWSDQPQVRLGFSLLSAASLPFGAGLFYISVVLLKALCPVCIGVYICIIMLNIAMLGVIWNQSVAWRPSRILLHQILLMAAINIVGIVTWKASESSIRAFLISAEQRLQDQLKLGDLVIAPTSKIDFSSASMIRIGKPDAPIHMVKYIDLECGFCRLLWRPIKNLVQSYHPKIYLEIRQLPLHPACNPAVKKLRHPLACELAAAAQCASNIGKAEEFADWAFMFQGRIGNQAIRSKLAELGDPSVADCMSSDSTRNTIASDVQSAIASGAKGTPHILINGQRYIGALNASGIDRAIKLILNP